jgi:rhodanese-related sulfurtransferase
MRSGGAVLDTRSPADFATGHLSGSINVGLQGRFAEYAGDVLSPEEPIALVCDQGTELEAKIRLARIGFDNVTGVLRNPELAMIDSPELVERSSRLSATELVHRRSTLPALVIVDVRGGMELERGAIPGSRHIPLPRLVARLGELEPSQPTVVYCASGFRSSIAASVLRAAGFEDVSDLLGGYEAWSMLSETRAP